VVLNEVQMLLHESGVNRQRENEGRPMINSVWFWGGGRLSSAHSCDTTMDLVIAAYPVAGGLARLAACDLDESGEALSRYLAGADSDHHRVLYVYDDLHHHIMTGDIYAQRDSIEALDQNCLAPALAALRSGRLDELELDTGTRHRRVNRRQLRRFWKRVRRTFQ
jgi:hypothetical protein